MNEEPEWEVGAGAVIVFAFFSFAGAIMGALIVGLLWWLT